MKITYEHASDTYFLVEKDGTMYILADGEDEDLTVEGLIEKLKSLKD